MMPIGTKCADGGYWACLRCPFWFDSHPGDSAAGRMQSACYPSGERWVAMLLNGGYTTTVVTLIGWLVELAVVGITGERQGIVGLVMGLLAGTLVALFTLLLGRRTGDNDTGDTSSIE